MKLSEQYRKYFELAWSPEASKEAVKESFYLALSHIQDFKFKKLPEAPREVAELKESETFRELKRKGTSDSRRKMRDLLNTAWKGQDNFIDSRGTIRSQNKSNYHFLLDLKGFFLGLGDDVSVNKVDPVLSTFCSELYEPIQTIKFEEEKDQSIVDVGKKMFS